MDLPQNDLPKPKRRYYKKAKKEPTIGDTAKLDRRQAAYDAAAHCKRKGKKPTLLGQPTDGHWVYTAAGWKRSGEQAEKLPDQQITRYFKMTKTLQEIQYTELPQALKEAPKTQTQEERSELRVPTLERCETYF